jgi:hypothetical protein
VPIKLSVLANCYSWQALERLGLEAGRKDFLMEDLVRFHYSYFSFSSHDYSLLWIYKDFRAVRSKALHGQFIPDF